MVKSLYGVWRTEVNGKRKRAINGCDELKMRRGEEEMVGDEVEWGVHGVRRLTLYPTHVVVHSHFVFL